jgi:hypothetical protein
MRLSDRLVTSLSDSRSERLVDLSLNHDRPRVAFFGHTLIWQLSILRLRSMKCMDSGAVFGEGNSL